MTRHTIILLISTFLLTAPCIGQEKDELYLNYVAAIKNGRMLQYFIVVKVKDIKHGTIREYCTKASFLKGALHREYNLGYDKASRSKVDILAIDNKDRYFEFKKKKAIKNLSHLPYSLEDLKQFEKTVNFDSIATQIKIKNEWSIEIYGEKTVLMYAHSLFNRGILTAYGTVLFYVDRNKQEF
ncbi:MAG: hypothetical protein V4677_13615 [Bacteroidota bacterium]